GTEGRFYWLCGLRRSCFMVNQTITAKASYQKANKIRSYGVIFHAVGITSLRFTCLTVCLACASR
ncbi:MAG: hypothetical protein OIF54_10545, partial [Cohaesibacter sp.]|nr:hypothetical protein [Cohaesibacter sp.]